MLENRDFRRNPEGCFLSFRGQWYSSIFIRAGYPLRHLLFSHFLWPAQPSVGHEHARSSLSQRRRVVQLRSRAPSIPLLSFYAPGLTAGGGFLFSGRDAMFCPYPGKCEYDRFPKAGIHNCMLPKCRYHLYAEALLRHEIEFLASIKRPTAKQALALIRLRAKYTEEFGGKRNES